MNSKPAAEQLYQSVLHSVDHAIIALDDQGSVVFANEAAVRLIATSSQDVLGKAHHTLLRHATTNGEIFEQDSCPICQAFREGVARRSEECAFYNSRGEHFPVEYALHPLAESKGIRAVLSFADVTQRRKLHHQLIQSQKLQSIGELAAGIAHEINTPVQYINDNLQFLRGAFDDICQLVQQHEQALRASDSPELVAQYDQLSAEYDTEFLVSEVPTAIEQSIEGTDRVATIVRAMKEFAHPSENSKAAVDLNRVIESAVTVARNEWKYVAQLDMELDPLLPNVACLGNEMHQVILNLVVNAAHAIADVIADTGGKGRITIETRAVAESAEIRISDTGGGIPESLRSRIFDPFFTTKDVGRGTGQGLSLAHTVIVEKHSGSIDFETKLGSGTTFILRLPIFADKESVETVGNNDEEASLVCR